MTRTQAIQIRELRWAVVVTALLAACSSGSTDAKRTPSSIVVVSGSSQTGVTGAALPQPLVARVTASDGTAIAGQVVDFTVQSGTATVNPTSATTDATGTVQTVATAGSSAGTVVIVATVHSTSLNAIFTATVQAATDASCTGATPVSLALGETRTGLSGSSICLTNTAAAEYLVHVFFSTSVQSAQTQVSITGSGIVASSPTPPPSTSVATTSASSGLRSILEGSARLRNDDPQRVLDLRLRQLERNVLAPRMSAARAAMRQRRALFAGTPPAVGSFMQLNADEDCTKTANPNIRVGRVAAVTNTAIVVTDTLNPAGGFTDADYQSIGVTFDTLVNSLDTAAFGAPTDIDNNGHIILFYTSAVNALTPANSNGVVLGFFNPRDLFPTTATPTLQACTASNFAEMFYLIVPDPNGTINGNTRTKADVQQFTIGTTMHEYQHLINGSRRLYINNADDFEEVWLNEGLSHIAEELLYYHAAGLTPRQNIDSISIRNSAQRVNAVNSYQIENIERFELFLEQPTANSPYADNDSLETRGATWSFLRYAADHQGTSDGTIWKQLVNSTTTGLQNLTNVFGGTILNEMRDWSISVYTDDFAPVTAAFQQPSWNMRAVLPLLFSNYPLTVTPLTNAVPKSVSVVAGGSVYTKIGVAAGATASVAWSVGSPSAQISIVRTK